MNDLWQQDIYLKAYRFAAEAHKGQTYPGTGISYIMHLSFVCMEVTAGLRAEPGRDENLAIQCALLHDVIEDTDVTYEQVEAQFGERVAGGVLALTKNRTVGDKPAQMADSLHRIRQQPHEVWMVKLADRISNLGPPPTYWTIDKKKRYQAEAAVILEQLGEASRFLADRLNGRIENYPDHF